MIGLLTLTVAGAAAVLTQAQAELGSNPQMITDPDLGTFAKEGTVWLYPIIRNEARDPNWAPTAERTLKDRYATVQFFGTKPQTLRVMCRTKTCEVAVSVPAIKSGATYGQTEAAIVEDMRAKGLVQAGAIVSGDMKSDRGLYLAYYQRAD